MRKIIFLYVGFLFLAGSVGMSLWNPSPAAGADVHLVYGSTRSTSGIYAHEVAVGTVINKYAPGIKVTVVESGGAYENLRRMREGTFDIAGATGWPGSMELYVGLATFKGNPWKEVRLLFLREITYMRVYVTAEQSKKEGIKTFTDLKGKKFTPGMPGSAAAAWVGYINEVLGTDISMVYSSLGDAVKAMKEGRIVGTMKSSPRDRFDASMMECHFTTPLTIIGFTKQDAEKIRSKHPILMFAETPAGAIKELPGLTAIMEMVSPTGVVGSARMSEEVAYRIMKAVYENHGEIAKAYPAAGGFDPLKDFIKAIPPGESVPFHAGVVRYAKEKGIEMPAALIPPEYKGSR